MIKINDNSISSVYDETTVIGKIMKGTLLLYDSWKKLIASGVPPITLTKCKGVDLVDYKVYGNSVQNGTPTPDNPIEVISVGDKTKNLFPFNGVTHTVTDTNYNRTIGNIDVNIPAGQKITASADIDATLAGNDQNAVSLTLTYEDDTTYQYYYWNSNCIKIPKGEKGRSYTTVTATKNVKNINFTQHAFNSDGGTTIFRNFQIEVGDSVTYEPYGYKIPIKTIGKNLKNWQVTHAEFINTYYNGFSNNWNFRFEIPKYMLGNTFTYSAHFDLTSAKNNDSKFVSGAVKVWLYDENTSVIRVLFASNTIYEGESGISKITFNIPENAKYIALGLEVRANDEKIIVSNPQIEIGKATPYEPYIEENSNIYLDAPLRKIGNDADYVDFKNQKVIRNINAKLLTSEMYWQNTYYPVLLISLSTNEIGKYGGDTPIMMKYSSRPYFRFINVYGTSIGFSYCDTYWNFATTDDLKAWLDEKGDVTVYYPLLTPMEEVPIELPNIPTHKGTTIIEVDTDILPSNMEVTYIGKK